jgi:type IV pilus assembly protein PilA
MFNALRRRAGDEGGFTLIELLVVILIIGILAAIAIPAFLSQTTKASDSAAKTQVGTLQTTMETYAAEHNGSYAEATIGELQKIEPTLNDTSQATPKVNEAEPEIYEVQSTDPSTGNVFFLKNNKGNIERTCTTAGKGGCKANGSW